MTTSKLLGVAIDESDDGQSLESDGSDDDRLLFEDSGFVPRSNEGITTPKKPAFLEEKEWEVVYSSQHDADEHLDDQHPTATGQRAEVRKQVWKPKSDGTGLQKLRRLDIVLVEGGALNSDECLEDMYREQDEKERKQQEKKARVEQHEARREEKKREDEEKRKWQEERKHAVEEKKEEKRRRAMEREEAKRQRDAERVPHDNGSSGRLLVLSVGTMAPHAHVATLALGRQKNGPSVTRANSGSTMGASAWCGAMTVPTWNKRILIGSAPCVGQTPMPAPMGTTPRHTCLGVTLP